MALDGLYSMYVEQVDVGAEKLNGGQQDGRRLLPTEATRSLREMPMSMTMMNIVNM